MAYTLNEKQQMFVDAYRQRIGFEGDFADALLSTEPLMRWPHLKHKIAPVYREPARNS